MSRPTHCRPTRRSFRNSRAFSVTTDAQSFAEVLLLHLRNVQQHYSRLFEPVVQAPEATLQFPPDEDSRDTLDRLAAMGFRNPLEISGLVRGWLSGKYLALRSEFARAQLRLLVPSLIEHLARSENREQAVLAFDKFLAGLHAAGGARLISLLLQNPDLLALVALDARNRAAACRHSRASAAGHGCADRSGLLRRAAECGDAW